MIEIRKVLDQINSDTKKLLATDEGTKLILQEIKLVLEEGIAEGDINQSNIREQAYRLLSIRIPPIIGDDIVFDASIRRDGKLLIHITNHSTETYHSIVLNPIFDKDKYWCANCKCRLHNPNAHLCCKCFIKEYKNFLCKWLNIELWNDGSFKTIVCDILKDFPSISTDPTDPKITVFPAKIIEFCMKCKHRDPIKKDDEIKEINKEWFQY